MERRLRQYRGLYLRRGKNWFEAKAAAPSRLRYVIEVSHRSRMEHAAMLNDGVVRREASIGAAVENVSKAKS